MRGHGVEPDVTAWKMALHLISWALLSRSDYSIRGSDFRIDVFIRAMAVSDRTGVRSEAGTRDFCNLRRWLHGHRPEIQLLFLRAWQLRGPLRLNERELFLTREDLRGWSIPTAIGLTSLVFALTLPLTHLSWSGWIYFSMVIIVPVHRRLLRRRAPA